jgi:cell pole-organizing protein PopZ
MTQPAKAQEPSMEAILASIRRIIADDETKTPPKAAEPLPPPPTPVPPSPPLRAASPPPVRPPKPVEIDTLLSDLNRSPPLPPAPPAPDVLELTEAMTAPPARADAFRTIDGQSDIVFEDSPEEPAPEPQRPPSVDTRQRGGDLGAQALVSQATTAAVDSAFNSLAQTVLVQNARTLEDLVREMLRPLLKSWLDDNLPGLVERLVRAEIERVSRGRS